MSKFDISFYQDFDEKLLSFSIESFDINLYVCKTCHSKIKSNKTPQETLHDKLLVPPIPLKLHSLRKLEKIVICQIILKMIAMMHGTGKFRRVKGSIYNILIEAGSVCKTVPRGADSDALVLVK